MNDKLVELFEGNTNVSYFVHTEYFQGDNPPDISFASLLNLNSEKMKPFTKTLLEDPDILGDREDIKDLRAGIYAFAQTQDILNFDFTIYNSSILSFDSGDFDPDVWYSQHYCYYESLVYLRESVVSWLEQNVLAALTLLRPFLELAISHLYWHLQCDNCKSFYRWFRDEKRKPPFKNLLNAVFDNLREQELVAQEFLDATKKILSDIYATCCAYNHTPRIEESIVTLGAGRDKVSVRSFLYYCHLARTLLRRVMYLYVLAYPISMFPVNRYERWGFWGGPIGSFFDENNYAILKAYLGPEMISNLRQQLESSPHVQGLCSGLFSFFEQAPKLTEQEMMDSWEEFKRETDSQIEANSIGEMIAISKAHKRALGWLINYSPKLNSNV